MKVHHSIFVDLVSPEHLFGAWEEFRKGKRSRPDVQEFEWRLEENILSLHRDLASGEYRHGPYSAFTICDPKQRPIHKAAVRDRIVHHAIFAMLSPVFDPAFIAHSFSCRTGKGTHRAVDALERMLWQVSRNQTQPCFVLKCDVHQFFASVDHALLLSILGSKIKDQRVMELLAEVVDSFGQGKGIPIGNLTSQLFANVYLDVFDQFIKHELKVARYIRYTDDFVVAAGDKSILWGLLPPIREFLKTTLHLNLHPRKVEIRSYHQGIDFLGYVLRPHHRVLRTRTKRRMLRKLRQKAESCAGDAAAMQSANQSLQSYLGVLSHANAYGLAQELRNRCWLWMTS